MSVFGVEHWNGSRYSVIAAGVLAPRTGPRGPHCGLGSQKRTELWVFLFMWSVTGQVGITVKSSCPLWKLPVSPGGVMGRGGGEGGQ